MRYFNLIVIFLFATCVIQADVVKRDYKEELTCSVIIPCHHLHIRYLKPLLHAYEEQTRIPDEIVVSLSGTDYIQPLFIDALQNAKFPYKFTLVLSKKNKTEGENLNT